MPHMPASPPAYSHLQRMMAAMNARGAAPLDGGDDACCFPAAAVAQAAAAPEPAARRARLADLDANLHCSIIGTCLTTGELRKLVPRHAAHIDRKLASDLEIHHTAVELSTDGGPAAKELHKALDARHMLAIRRFKDAADAAALGRLWREALASGDVPGAYWALMTHPGVSFDLRRQAFGDVHMLSHLVGASNRADIRRLAQLEEECAELREQNGRQQSRLHDMSVQHELAMRELERQLAQATGQLGQRQATVTPAIEDAGDKLALHAARRDEAERKLQSQDDAMRGLRAALQQVREEAGAFRAEAQALEQALEQTLRKSLPQASQAEALPVLSGKRVVYVGGRPGALTVLGTLVASAGGELLVHDGGIEDRRGMLAAMLPQAHMVVFPVDCISHNAMHVTKQACARLDIPCHPLRTASVASFVELMQRLAV